jgi:MFS family permease
MSHVLTLDTAQEKRLLLSLSGIQFTHILDVMIIMPLAPMLMRTFNLSTVQFGWLVSAYTLTAAAAAILAAIVIDRFDRRHVVLGFYGAFIVATALCAAAPSYTLLLMAWREPSGGYWVRWCMFTSPTPYPMNVAARQQDGSWRHFPCPLCWVCRSACCW